MSDLPVRAGNAGGAGNGGDLIARYRAVRARAEAAAGGRAFTLIAVSKIQPADAVASLYREGHRDFGENYAQELAQKAAELAARGCPGIRWHFIGHLQTNKAKAILPAVHAVHAVSSLRLADELARRWRALGRPARLPIFMEVNLDDETSKSGVAPADAPPLAGEINERHGMHDLELRGLMCIPSPDAPVGELSAFARLRALEERCRPATRGDLSMGMSGDFEAALREGATHVRVGTSIFGERPPR